MSDVLRDCEEEIDKAQVGMFGYDCGPMTSFVSRTFRIHDCVDLYFNTSLNEEPIPSAFSHQFKIADIH